MAGKPNKQSGDQPSLLDDELPQPNRREELLRRSSRGASPPNEPVADRDGYIADASAASAVWAAWADALGFISELTHLDGLYRRLGMTHAKGDGAESLQHLVDSPPSSWPLTKTVEWSRRVGGRGGATMRFPAGTYSDDTQLRLATSRCIDHGRYSPEHFAYIELPTFTSYGLGGGHATKAGAAAMSRSSSVWANPGHDSWAHAGGNGVVMRAAPLGYAAAAFNTSHDDLALDVIRNGIVTHGHPRALLPACLHARALAEGLRHRRLPRLEILHGWLEELASVPDLMAQDPVLGSESIPEFDKRSSRGFERTWLETIQEIHTLIERFEDRRNVRGGNLAAHYLTTCRDVGLFDKNTLGVGTATFVAAYWLADAYRHDPISGIQLAANAVGSDTDTIATVAAAHLGTVEPLAHSNDVLDREYIERETLRLVAPSDPRAAAPMRYPDLWTWQPPKAQADYVGIEPGSGRTAIAGLGSGDWFSAPSKSGTNADFVWQWFATDYGQSLPVKRRTELSVLPATALPPIVPLGRPGQATVQPSEELDELRARAVRASETAKKTKKQDSEPRVKREPVEAADESHHIAPSTPAEVASDTPAQLRAGAASDQLERALNHAEANHFSPDVVGQVWWYLTTHGTRDEAFAFYGFVTAHWENRPG